MTLEDNLVHCQMNITDVTLENAVVMLYHTAETRSEEQPNLYIRPEKVEKSLL